MPLPKHDVFRGIGSSRIPTSVGPVSARSKFLSLLAENAQAPTSAQSSAGTLWLVSFFQVLLAFNYSVERSSKMAGEIPRNLTELGVSWMDFEEAERRVSYLY